MYVRSSYGRSEPYVCNDTEPSGADICDFNRFETAQAEENTFGRSR